MEVWMVIDLDCLILDHPDQVLQGLEDPPELPDSDLGQGQNWALVWVSTGKNHLLDSPGRWCYLKNPMKSSFP